MSLNGEIAGVDIGAIKFDLILQNVKDMKKFPTKIIHVRGLQWKVGLLKIRNSLFISLQLLKTDLQNRYILAALKLKIMLKSGNEPYEIRNNNILFISKALHFAFKAITWSDLIDPKNDYIDDDTCRIRLKIEASEMVEITKNNNFKLEPIQNCCDHSNFGKFRLTINRFNKIDKLFGVVSPDIVLCGVPWQIRLMRNETNNLSLIFRNAFTYDAPQWSCRVTLYCELLSFDPNIKPVEVKFKNFELDTTKPILEMVFIFWGDLILQQNRFIENGSFVIDMSIKIKETTGFPKIVSKRTAPTACNPTDCSICLESYIGQSPSTTLCGHIFCTPCITEALGRRKVCPQCNKTANLNQLRVVHL